MIGLLSIGASCKKGDGNGNTPPGEPPVIPPVTFDINSIEDTYAAIAPFTNYYKWSVYNVHDPSVLKDGDWYYMYSTDVGYGTDVPAGLQIRKSKAVLIWSTLE